MDSLGYVVIFGVLAAATWLVINYPVIGVPLAIIGALKVFVRE
jgi:hypothetical protein